MDIIKIKSASIFRSMNFEYIVKYGMYVVVDFFLCVVKFVCGKIVRDFYILQMQWNLKRHHATLLYLYTYTNTYMYMRSLGSNAYHLLGIWNEKKWHVVLMTLLMIISKSNSPNFVILSIELCVRIFFYILFQVMWCRH